MNKKIIAVIGLMFAISLISIYRYILVDENRVELKGNLEIWTKEDTYEYMIEAANQFEEVNKNVSIDIKVIDENEYVNMILDEKKNSPDIVQLNFRDIYDLNNRVAMNTEVADKVIKTYENNFSKGRIQQASIEGEIIGVPFTSNPLALYVRKDILETYGYDYLDINTWSDLLRVGIDIFNKTNGDIRLFTAKDWENIQYLISAQSLQEESLKEVDKVMDLIDKELKSIKDKELVGVYGENNYLSRVTSIEFVKEEEESQGEWICLNIPSIKPGGSKFYDIGGESFVVLSNDSVRNEVIEAFLGYLTSNVEGLSKELVKGNFVPSAVYSYRSKTIENNNSNVKNVSPSLAIANIAEKAKEIEEYEKFIEIIKSTSNDLSF